jgi:hypothetical protein
MHDLYAPTVLEVLLPNGDSSKADCAVHAVDVHIRDRQSNRRLHPNDNL